MEITLGNLLRHETALETYAPVLAYNNVLQGFMPLPKWFWSEFALDAEN